MARSALPSRLKSATARPPGRTWRASPLGGANDTVTLVRVGVGGTTAVGVAVIPPRSVAVGVRVAPGGAGVFDVGVRVGVLPIPAEPVGFAVVLGVSVESGSDAPQGNGPKAAAAARSLTMTSSERTA